ncbi:urease subunit beta [Patulibacter minatonensis]|uniref:urease subunit beta n=1 Tax=Patulibacter minatonensis TaxID=298163 RepID=UPI0004B7E566|nr:urease subunit beta [Patulibacter minatonensis]
MTDLVPGEILTAEGDVPLLPDRPRTTVRVVSTGDRPIQVGSHFHLFEANPALRFDRGATYGTRLAIPAGTAVRFEPGEVREVEVVPFGGARVVHGFHGLVEGPLDAPGAREAALGRLAAAGFLDDGPAGTTTGDPVA